MHTDEDNVQSINRTKRSLKQTLYLRKQSKNCFSHLKVVLCFIAKTMQTRVMFSLNKKECKQAGIEKPVTISISKVHMTKTNMKVYTKSMFISNTPPLVVEVHIGIVIHTLQK